MNDIEKKLFAVADMQDFIEQDDELSKIILECNDLLEMELAEEEIDEIIAAEKGVRTRIKAKKKDRA